MGCSEYFVSVVSNVSQSRSCMDEGPGTGKAVEKSKAKRQRFISQPSFAPTVHMKMSFQSRRLKSAYLPAEFFLYTNSFIFAYVPPLAKERSSCENHGFSLAPASLCAKAPCAKTQKKNTAHVRTTARTRAKKRRSVFIVCKRIGFVQFGKLFAHGFQILRVGRIEDKRFTGYGMVEGEPERMKGEPR